MTETTSQFESSLHLEEPKKLSSTLNVLTILTFIGSALAFFSGFYSFASSEKTFQKMKETYESGQFDSMPEFAKKMMLPLEYYQKLNENRLPIMLLTVIAAVLCIFGAIQMRKLLKQGFYIYLIGEILPLLIPVLFVGGLAFNMYFYIGFAFTALFIILYAVQSKHLHNAPKK